VLLRLASNTEVIVYSLYFSQVGFLSRCLESVEQELIEAIYEGFEMMTANEKLSLI